MGILKYLSAIFNLDKNGKDAEQRKQEALERAFEKLSKMSKEDFSATLNTFAGGTRRIYNSFPPSEETKVNVKITLIGELPPLTIDAEEDLLLASQKCLDNFGIPQIDSCQILNDQVYFYDINGYLSMTIPREAFGQWLLIFEKTNFPKATDTDALVKNLKNKLETPINDRLVYPVFGHEIGESIWDCFMLDTQTGEIRKMTEEEKAKISRY